MITSQFIPTDTGGGTVVGGSYLKAFDLCPRDWFNQYFRPVLSDDGTIGARGIQPITTPLPLLRGRLLHEAFAAWYLSGCREGVDTGDYDLDLALDTLHTHCAAAKATNEFEGGDEEADRVTTALDVMMRSYADTYGPGGPSRDWPEIQIAHDAEGKPLVEREFRIQLSPSYIFTCRIDAVIYHRSYLKAFETKTSYPMFVKNRLKTISYDAQFTGEIAVLTAHLPTLIPSEPKLHGCLANVLPYDRSVNSKFAVAERETTTRTPAQLERWRSQSLHTLHRIDDSVRHFEGLRGDRLSIEDAADRAFPTLGTRTDRCHAYNRRCAYWDLCALPGLEPSLLRRFRPRTTAETTYLREYPS